MMMKENYDEYKDMINEHLWITCLVSTPRAVHFTNQ